jgi:hypothetical protein
MIAMRKIILVLATLAVTSGSQMVFADIIKDYVFVPSDADIAKGTMTRDEFNKQFPSAGKRWREAWAVEGTKNDTGRFANIRKISTRPADMKPNAGASPTVKGN